MKPSQPPVTFETVRQIALALPNVEEGTAYGTPAFRIKEKILARLKEDGESLMLKVGEFERDALIQLDPDTFYITDHYRGYPAVLIRLSKIDHAQLRDLFRQAWRFVAPKRMVAQFDKKQQAQ